MDIGAIWQLIILNPMINILVVVSKFLFNSPGLAIIVFTVIIRLAMYPLTRKQLQASKKMQDIQPKIQELKKKYGKDPQRMAKEQAALLKEAGVANVGCILPMLIQTPIWIALYQSIMRILATAPEELLNLSQHLYSSWSVVFPAVPLNSRFLWLDLGAPDALYILPILVGGTMWLQQKMVTPKVADPQQQSQSQMMLVMMPLLFAFMTLSFPSGLALYWVVSNIVGIVVQYFVTGWGGLADMFGRNKADVSKSPKPSSESKLPPAKQIDSTARNVTADSQKTEKRKPIWKIWK
ncbi:MAG: membrane protein insertase YidC [Dehalococcoidales bacterium]|nr:membrane protein insertase YidC [Dehalococcoidales bacterium]